jgi:hypothetical protein
VNNPGLKKLEGDKKERFLDELHSINDVLKDNDLWLEKWREWCHDRSSSYIVSNYNPFKFRGVGIILRILNLTKILSIKNTIPVKLNFLECESHREVLIQSLKDKINND